MAIRQSGHNRSRREVKPIPLDEATGINVKERKATFFYWTVAGEARQASGNTSGRIQFFPPLRTIAQAIGGLDDYTKAGARIKMQEEAEDIQLEMQQDAPWEDRGGTARESLFANVSESANILTINAGYDTEYLLAFQRVDRQAGTFPRNYSVFLETMQHGRFAIVSKTLESRYSTFMEIFQGMWEENNRINEGFGARKQRKAEEGFRKARLAQLKGAS